MNRILVIGGTGTVGRHVVDLLAGTDAPFTVMTRNPDTAGLRQHVEVVRGDLTVPETLDSEVGVVRWVSSSPHSLRKATIGSIRDARRAGR
jgi:uncharacterized protein YbjT (DUF2867 family)